MTEVKFDDERFTIGFSADSSGNERSNRDIIGIDRSLLIDTEMRRSRAAITSGEGQKHFE